ncbi:hypothetical protein FOQG_16148 [Fusarium oxysporum f. sp. raphani 54005]|uniref:Uncharacterized protein n=1 Tax=Fusarium oxysporum f. sp. raphani 54005 TaxID=1089458 RepID=X0BK09_FUSOX|nr:hypothetical protein FOQG_16148 [Fusarium oxysporum f. sp. raphani 54005]
MRCIALLALHTPLLQSYWRRVSTLHISFSTIGAFSII